MADLELTYAVAEQCAAQLKHVCERLKPYFDFSTVAQHLSAESVLGAALVASDPSPCSSRVHTMVAGGLDGLRAYLHFASEAIFLNRAGFDPTSNQTALEPLLPKGLSAEDAMIARHQALFSYEGPEGNGTTLWARAHCEALGGEIGMLEHVIKAHSNVSPDRGLLFWSDPGFSPQQIDMHADVAMKLGLTLIPRSVASPDAFRAAYEALAKLAEGTSTSSR